jgi:CheY-like chemotaxis protein
MESERLAISQRFTHLMRGDIDVTSASGEGSAFTLELPAKVSLEAADASDSPLVHEPAMEAVVPGAAATTVLVIDDDPTVRDLMTRFLGKMGYLAVPAPSGPEGLRLARELRPAIITLDVVMPDMSGWDVLSELKADPDLASIPVIMITIVDHEALGLARGASNYLMKPIDRDRLAVALDKYARPDQPVADMALDYSGSR